MKGLWNKETGRRLALILCAALIFTCTFQNFARAETKNHTEDSRQSSAYKIFLNLIRVEGDNRDQNDYQQEFEKSVSGNDIVIGGKVFQIGQYGEIIDAYQAATVSGNDMYITADAPQVEILYKEDDNYFEAMATVSGNEGAKVVLSKKHTLNAEIKIHVGGKENVPLWEVYPDAEPRFHYTNQYGQPVNPQAVRASEAPFQVRAQWCGVETSRDAILDDTAEFVFRGYTEYGRDLQIWDRNGNIIDRIEQGIYYNVGKIVIPGYERTPEDPFDKYELVLGGDRICDDLGKDPVEIPVSSVSGGDASLRLYMDGAGEGNQENCTIRFLVDNTPPAVAGVSYKRRGETSYTEWTEGTALKDREGISMRFDISEAHGISSVQIVYKDKSGEITREELGLAPEQKGPGAEYVYEWKGAEPDAHYTEVGLLIEDMAGNTATWGSVTYLLDQTAPRVNRITWEKEEEPGVVRELDPSGEAVIAAKKGITLVYHVTEDNEMGAAVLRYTDENGRETTLSGEQKRESGAYTGYSITYRLDRENTTYRDLQLYLEDELGNAPEAPTAGLTAILDCTPPAVEKISWAAAGQPAAEVAGPQVLVDGSGICFTVDVKEENLASVGLYYLENGERKQIDQQSGDSRFAFSISTSKYNYKPLFFEITDKSGNRQSYGLGGNQSLKVVIDQAPPVMSDLVCLPQRETWYREQKNPLQYSFHLKDYSDLKSIRMISVLADGTEISWDLTEDCKKISGRDEEGYYHYRVVTRDDRFASAQDQNQYYYFEIEDQWHNRLSTRGEGQNTVHMLVDNTPPSSMAYVKYRGDQDIFYNAQDQKVQAPEEQYQYGKLSGKLFNNSLMDLTVYVADFAADDAVSQAASGVKQVQVVYRYTDRSLAASKESTGVFTYENGNTENGIKTSSMVTVDGRVIPMDEVSLRFSVKNGQKILAIESVEVTDVAGNTTLIREYGDADGLTVDYILDDKAPELSHVIPGGSSGYNRDANTIYYNTREVELAVFITENNFYPEEVLSKLRAEEATRTIAMSGFQDMGGYRYRSDFAMNDGEGKYQFTLSYADRSGNAMIFQGEEDSLLVDGTYKSPILVLDTTPPVLDIAYYSNGQNISDQVYGGNCVKGDVTAVISVTEANFDPNLVEIAFRAMDASDNREFGMEYNPSAWSQNGDTYTYSIPCSTEGHYSLTARCTDKAGNHSGGVAHSDFVLDKTAPAVDITYNATTENGYYNEDRVATVTVMDQNFEENTAEYMVTGTGEQPVMGNWSHTAANGCNGTVHVKACSWSCLVAFHADGDYSFTFRCADRAGNESGALPEETFTVDQTLPVIQVSYDNMESQNGFYYKEARNAVITVREHNFNSAHVQLSVSSPDGVVKNPSPWRNNGTDLYVCEIPFDVDGDYSFDISCVDLAGNAAEAYAGDRFVIDLTAPRLEISGIQDQSANNGIVAPVITCSDKNFDAQELEIYVTGVNHGPVETEYSSTPTPEGQTIELADFAHVPEMDDLYTLEASVTDKAGNITAESIWFSVNRFGSVYVFGEDTQSVIDQYYVNQGPGLTVTEINVDTLEHQEISYSCDGNVRVLRQNEDYLIRESGDTFAWKEYHYEIPGSNFDSEGVYVVTLQSVDQATNDTTNRLKEMNIEFVVDKTSPSVVTGGIEDGGSYAETGRILSVDAVDNIYLEGVEIYLNGALAASYDEGQLAESYGRVEYEIREMGNTQTVYILARDAAGNVTQTQPIRFLISSNAFIRWFYNRPLFIGSIAGTCMISGGTFALRIRRKGRKVKRK